MPDHAANLDTDGLLSKYAQIMPLYDDFSSRVAALLHTLVAEQGTRFQTIEYRAKSVEGFREKLRRPEKSYADPLREITDLAGARVIVYYSYDLDRIASLIDKEFEVDSENSSDRRDLLGINEFGYVSVHKVVGLNGTRVKLPEWKRFANLKIEIQIRTVLQHAWAAVSHSLDYKHEGDLAPELRRQMFRISGLLEIADDQFSALSRARQQFVEESEAAISKGDLDIPIDSATLASYIESSEVIATAAKTAETVGFSFDDDFVADESEGDPKTETLSKLAKACATAGIERISDLDRLLKNNVAIQRTFLKQIFDGDWYITPEFLTHLLVILGAPSEFSTASMQRIGWSKNIAQRVLRVAMKLNNTHS